MCRKLPRLDFAKVTLNYRAATKAGCVTRRLPILSGNRFAIDKRDSGVLLPGGLPDSTLPKVVKSDPHAVFGSAVISLTCLAFSPSWVESSTRLMTCGVVAHRAP